MNILACFLHFLHLVGSLTKSGIFMCIGVKLLLYYFHTVHEAWMFGHILPGSFEFEFNFITANSH